MPWSRVPSPLCLALLATLACVPPPRPPVEPIAPSPPQPELGTRFGELALACVEREYPNLIHHVLQDETQVRAPHELTPAFYGCYDWHSAVHAHWLLARIARLSPELPVAAQARLVLSRSLSPLRIAGELDYMRARPAFERPYGLAWLLQLAAELHVWDDPDARVWARELAPLVELAVEHLSSWLEQLSHHIRSGEHSQTAFAMGLALDYARTVDNLELEQLLTSRALRFHRATRDCALHLEPSGHDFLSPCLAEADLMRRVLRPEEFADWLEQALPTLPYAEVEGWLPVARVTNPSDGKLAHLDGLNLSRAWMLEGIASGLPPRDRRIVVLRNSAARHREAGLAKVSDEHYAGGHWLGSFALYLSTRRGLSPFETPAASE